MAMTVFKCAGALSANHHMPAVSDRQARASRTNAVARGVHESRSAQGVTIDA